MQFSIVTSHSLLKFGQKCTQKCKQTEKGEFASILRLTGYVVDYHVMSKYCQACAYALKELGKDSLEFNEWKKDHASTCMCNYTGSSPAMEVGCIVGAIGEVPAAVHYTSIGWRRKDFQPLGGKSGLRP